MNIAASVISFIAVLFVGMVISKEFPNNPVNAAISKVIKS